MSDNLLSRIPEPELMEEAEQAKAYAEADFTEPHNMFVEAFRQRLGHLVSGTFLDLGCGTGDITCRFAVAFPRVEIHGIDGSKAMLTYAERTIKAWKIQERITLVHATIPLKVLPLDKYNGIIVNSLLHHLRDPLVLWQTIKQWAANKAPIFVMDLLRPQSKEIAKKIVETYSGKEAEILKRDFYRSLLAAYRIDEVASQLRQAGLDYLHTEVISDRHFIVWGRLG